VAHCVEEAREEGPQGTTVIRAAGGVVVRERDGRPEVLLVHRPRYDDWTFPKGKAALGETDEDCALREVEEETGLQCELLDELPSTEYRDGQGRTKRVRYWRMRPIGDELAFEHEVDDAVWLSPADARDRLSYDRDVEVLADMASLA
jgi:8-oxo-dGTP pyrophosphatase MutT (NUDIX family)